MIDSGKKVRIFGKQLTCHICGGEYFRERKTLLNSRGATFFNVDWVNEDAMNYICKDCGYIFWFADYDKHKNEQEESTAEDDECPNCFSNIESKETTCTKCGQNLLGSQDYK